MPTADSRRKALDEVDLRLIGELVADGRASYTALSVAVGLSSAAVRARVQAYLASRLITVAARVDARTVGAEIIEIALITVSRPAWEVAAALQAVDEAVFVACVTGPWGLMAEVRCRDRHHLVVTYERLKSITGIVDVDPLPIVEYFKQDWSGLADELTEHRTHGAKELPQPSSQPLDEIDERIVGEMMRDGRISFVDLAQRVGLSPPAVRTRAQRLLAERVVVIQTLVSQRVLGRGTFAGVLITTSAPVGALAEELAAFGETTLVAVSSGRHGVICELWSRDTLHLLDIVDRMRALSSVTRLECYAYLDIVKELYGVAQ